MGIRSLLAMFAVAFIAVGARASVLVTLDSATETGMPGQTLVFSATIENLDSVDAVTLNALDGSVDSPLTFDTTPSDAVFFTGLTIPAGGASADMILFDIEIPPAGVLVPHTYHGSFTLEDANSTVQGGGTFTVDVVPEASTWSALAIGLGVLALLRRGRTVA